MKIESVIERLEGWVKGQKIILNVAREIGEPSIAHEKLMEDVEFLINEIKKNVFGIDVKVVGKDDKILISLDLEESDMGEIYETFYEAVEGGIDYILDDRNW